MCYTSEQFRNLASKPALEILTGGGKIAIGPRGLAGAKNEKNNEFRQSFW